MSLRRIVIAATTMIVAVMLSIMVPIAQLETVADAKACCCPDPDACKCPDHDAHPDAQPSMTACHKQAPELQHSPLPAFVPPALVAVRVPARHAIVVATTHAEPHPAPAPDRPDAPS